MTCMIDDILFKSGITILVICQNLFASANEIMAFIVNNICVNVLFHARFQRGGGWGFDPLKSHKNTGFLRNTGPMSLNNHKATKPAFNVGHPRRFTGGPMMARI